jgi:hypothetical protein
MPAYHTYPDAMMRELPGYVSEEAPAVALPEEMHKRVKETLEKAFAHARSQGIVYLTIQQVFAMVAGSLLHAGVPREDMKHIMDYGTKWFMDNPHQWLTTINPETGRVWLASLRIPEHL